MAIFQKGLKALALGLPYFRGKRILIKLNLVETHAGHGHINTNPLLVRAVVELLWRMDAAEVAVAEGPGHRRDFLGNGIIGMEGDGPIMGTPIRSNVLVMGKSARAVDATCARLMGIDPHKILYLEAAGRRIGPIAVSSIAQRGETIDSVRKDFQLISAIPAQRDIRWSRQIIL